ncbi:hypothetical protein DRO61_09100 [Candidatus Bathyarchaeota archaeon]|nr:MAG: hypothetical protein DRO61_09100 [Candidatus Bathyarchaeota archaeon]
MIFKQKMKINKFKKLKKFNMESTTMKKSVKTLIMKLIVLTIDIFTRDWLKKKHYYFRKNVNYFKYLFILKIFLAQFQYYFKSHYSP